MSNLSRLDRLAWERLEHIRALSALSAELAVEARALYMGGESKTSLARRIGCSRVTLDAWLRR